MDRTSWVGKWLLAGVLAASTAVSVGCLTRPVGTESPTTKVNFTSTISQQAIDKIDLLFMIDNSSSMLDKQNILAEAVPNLLTGLLNPSCVDANGNQVGTSTADPTSDKAHNFNCPTGSTPEFNPVTDMHIGIVDSSLGTFGGDVCPESTPRYDDHGRLLNSSSFTMTTPVPDASPSNFLAWFPSNASNMDATEHPTPPVPAVKDFATLKTDFGSLVTGVGQNGCGLEAQLESWFHFLVAPDPWSAVTVTNGVASLGGPSDVDATVLQQRADFLRPDSLVAVISLSDEDDSSPDPQSLGGQGWAFDNSKFPGSTQARADGSTTAPRATTSCTAAGLGPLFAGSSTQVACTSCGFAATCNTSDPQCTLIKNDPNCQLNGGYYTAAEESLNDRYSGDLMRVRFGIDPQYPIQRYVDGLSKATVPNRASEHVISASGIGPYVGTPNCTNPLFAKTLPRNPGDELCALPRSTRTADLIFFAHIGGVPNALLHFDPTDASKSQITGTDWYPILGKDPINFDFTGIDPHMVESITPRAGLMPATVAAADMIARGDNGTDPDNGREWDTQGADLQYACTFPLPTASQTISSDPNADCAAGKNPPLCGTMPGQQIRAKAYPTVREFEVVRALGDQGIIASLCPISLTVDPTDPTYGYNPAVISIIARLKNALTTQCLPQKLTRDPSTTPANQVPCLVLTTLGDASDSCAAHPGLTDVDPTILAKFRQQQAAESGNTADGGTDLTTLPVCVLAQQVELPGATCASDTALEWCYVENGTTGSPAGNCPQALIFSGGTAALSGATFSLQCIQQSSEDAGSSP